MELPATVASEMVNENEIARGDKGSAYSTHTNELVVLLRGSRHPFS